MRDNERGQEKIMREEREGDRKCRERQRKGKEREVK